MKYIIDLDGTIMNGKEVNLDAGIFIKELERRGLEYIVMTNSIRSPQATSKRLATVDIWIAPDKIFNPISAINIYVEDDFYKSAFIVGSQLEVEQVAIKQNIMSPDIVILLDFENENIGYATLQKILQLMENDIPVIAASKSPFYLKEKKRILDTGAFVRLLECASDKTIKILGKPSRAYFESGLMRLGTKADQVIVIGDDWSTDIAGAKEIGCQSILLQSGKYIDGDEDKCLPDQVVSNLMEILK